LKKSVLARALRKRQIALGHHPRELIETLSNDEIIDAYVRCSRCMELFMSADVSGYASEADFSRSLDAAMALHQNVCGQRTLN